MIAFTGVIQGVRVDFVAREIRICLDYLEKYTIIYYMRN